VSTIKGVDTVLREATVTAFKQSLRGSLIAPGDDSYAEARQVWHGNIDRRPGLIARPIGVADVIQAVNFARDHNLLDVRFISSLPVMRRPACMAWADKRRVQIVWAEG